MARNRVDQLLAKVPLFSACSSHELAAISRLVTPVSIGAGKVVTRQDENKLEFIVIVEGTATVSIDGQVVATLGPGDFVGEIALLDGGPRTATVTADTDLVAEAMSAREFWSALEQSPQLTRSILKGVAARLRATDAELAR